MQSNSLLFSVSSSFGSQRLDAFLSMCFPEFSRRNWKQFCSDGLVRVNGKKKNGGHILLAEDTLSIDSKVFAEVIDSTGAYDRVEIRYEDEHIFIVSKPPMLNTARIRGKKNESLAHYLGQIRPECLQASDSEEDAGLVSRLDFYTSGLILGAKTREAWIRLMELQQLARIEKQYIALCEGQPSSSSFRISKPMSQSSDGMSMSLADERKKVFPAETQVIGVDKIGSKFSLIRLKGQSFRRHQLRLHLSSEGFPLVGDTKYSSKSSLDTFLDREGFFLHSEKIEFAHPVTNERVSEVYSSAELERLRFKASR